MTLLVVVESSCVVHCGMYQCRRAFLIGPDDRLLRFSLSHMCTQLRATNPSSVSEEEVKMKPLKSPGRKEKSMRREAKRIMKDKKAMEHPDLADDFYIRSGSIVNNPLYQPDRDTFQMSSFEERRGTAYSWTPDNDFGTEDEDMFAPAEGTGVTNAAFRDASDDDSMGDNYMERDETIQTPYVGVDNPMFSIDSDAGHLEMDDPVLTPNGGGVDNPMFSMGSNMGTGHLEMDGTMLTPSYGGDSPLRPFSPETSSQTALISVVEEDDPVQYTYKGTTSISTPQTLMRMKIP
eukprot:scpid82882/ scgid3421/ 